MTYDKKKKDIRTLNWYQRFWYPRQDKTIQKNQEKEKMKKYNIQNYIRYKEDLKESLKNLPDYGENYEKYTRKFKNGFFYPGGRRCFLWTQN